MAIRNSRGALANKPTFQLATDPAQLARQQARTQARIDAKGGLANAPGLAARMQQINGAIQNNQNQYSAGQVTGAANTQQQNLFNQMGQQQPLSTDYNAMRQKAEQTAMDSFNRNQQPQFQQQETAWRQRMAEQGIDPTSDRAQSEYKNMQQTQNDARQNAMTNAFQLGQGEQAQAFGQQATAAMMPYQQMGAITPYYQAQQQGSLQAQQNAWQGKQNDATRQVQMYGIRNQGGGGSDGLTMDQRIQLINAQAAANGYGALVANGGTQANSAGNPYAIGAAQGVAAGTAAGIGGSLR